jgi:hypothetical protein
MLTNETGSSDGGADDAKRDVVMATSVQRNDRLGNISASLEKNRSLSNQPNP